MNTLKPNVKRFHNSSSLPDTAEVAVVGGGPAGLATAIALANEQIPVIVIERSNYDQPRVGEHLTPEGVGCLQQLGLWTQQFIAQHQLCYGVRSVWGEAEIAHSDYVFHPYGCGINLSRPAFDITLADLAQQKGAHILLQSKFRRAQREEEKWRIVLETPEGTQNIRAKFIVDASGRQLVLAKRQGQTAHIQDQLIGMVCYLQTRNEANLPSEDTLLLESCEFGWWYFAQLKNNRGVCLHLTDSDLLCPGKNGHQRTWHERLQSTIYFQDLLSRYHFAEKILIKSARSHCLNQITGEGWLAVGDAAMSFDPLSSMGITKGIKSGMMAGQAIAQSFRGDRNFINQYEVDRTREFNQYLKMRFDYYQIENRWPSSTFWKRRHKIELDKKK